MLPFAKKKYLREIALLQFFDTWKELELLPPKIECNPNHTVVTFDFHRMTVTAH
jgi:hypothetical protein